MPRSLVTSSSAEARVTFARAKLEEWSRQPLIAILTPTRGAGDDLVRSLGQQPGRAGICRSTPLQLALGLAAVSLAQESRAPVSGVAFRAITIRAIQSAGLAGLTYFNRVSDTFGFVSACERTLSEIRLERVRPSDLKCLAPSGPDLAALLDCFEHELSDGQLADPADVYETAARSLDERGNAPWPNAVLMVDVLPSSRMESLFIQALAQRCDSVAAAALPGNDRRLRLLESALGVQASPLKEPGSRRTLDRIRLYVFSPDTPPPQPADNTLTFFSATDQGRECIEIARYILEAANHGTRFDDIAILLRDPQMYQPLVEEALSRAGIPGFYTQTSRRPNPSGRAFLALLACRSENFSASRFAEYLSLGQVPIPDAAGAPLNVPRRWVAAQGELFPLEENVEASDAEDSDSDAGERDPDAAAVTAGSLSAPHKWEQLLVDASVISGASRWETRLRGLREELLKQISAVEEEHDAQRLYLTRQLDHLDQLRAFAVPVIQSLADLPDSATWGEWLECLEALAGKTLRRPERVLAVLGELRPMSDVGPVRLEDIERVLSERLSFLRTEPSQRRYGQVFVATIPEAASRSFSHVFLPGLSEGLFPRKPGEDPLFRDLLREAVGANLEVSRDRIYRERELLHLAVGSARDHLLVSYPRMDLGLGRARVPSFYALDILRAAEGSIPDLDELENRAIESSKSHVGWPSPVASAEAIDDAEYDLATIASLLRRAPETVRGHARYLVECHPGLARSLRSRARRWKNFWSAADGLLDPGPRVLRLLDSYSARKRAYAPTLLEQVAVCPYKFFLRGIVRLYPRTEITRFETLDPLTRGSLFHTAQFRILTVLRDGLLPVTKANLERVTRQADEIFSKTAAEFHTRLAPAIERVWEREIEDLRADLLGWLRHEAEKNENDPGWMPERFEFAFGLSGEHGTRDPSSEKRPATLAGGYRLRGAIDLIETHKETHLLRVTDHKTGRPPSEDPTATGHGESLQPLLYGMAAEALLGETVSVSTLYFCTHKGDFRTIVVGLDAGVRKQAYATLHEIDEMIRGGFFPAAPRKAACSNCDYRMVCGPYEELRTGRKHQDRLEPLTRIRRTP